MLKNEKGITMMALVIMIVVLIILIGTGVTVGSSSIAEVKLQNFLYGLQQVQGKVDSIHEKMNMESNTEYVRLKGSTMGKNIQTKEAKDVLKSKGIDYYTIPKSNRTYYTEDGLTLYRYYSKEDLKKLDIKNAKQNVIVNFKTREVISVDGFNYYGTICFTKDDVTAAK